MNMLKTFKTMPKRYLALVLFLAVLLAPAPQALQADTADVCEGVGFATGEAGCGGDAGDKIDNTIATVINLLSVAIGVTAVIMIIIGGFKYVTSGGDSSSISSAKQTILYAIIGLVIVALAQIIVVFVLTRTQQASPPPGG